MSREMAERMLSAVTATIGGGFYPARRERVARLHDVLHRHAYRGHTLGGCRFVRWRGRILVLRELAGAAEPVRLTPGEAVLWDRRFSVSLTATRSKPATIGYLGSSGVAELGHPAVQPWRDDLPRLLFPTLPAVWDSEGLAGVPHLGYQRQGVVALPQLVFQPVNPLTRAGFAVV
jgi:hypothetical protein